MDQCFLIVKIANIMLFFIIYCTSYKTMGKLRVFEEDKCLNMQQEKLKSDMT